MARQSENWLDFLPPKAVREITLAPAQVLFKEGDTPRGVYCVEQGEILLERFSSNGEAIPIHRAQANTSFAEASLFADTLHCRAIATQPSVVRLVPRALLLDLLGSNAGFACAFCACLANDVRLARSRAALLSIRGAQERVLMAFTAGQGDRSIAALAADIALTPEATSRAIRQLCAQGELRQIGRGRYTRVSR